MSLARLPLCASLINSRFDNYTLLDVGCRTMELKPMLRGCRQYFGTDMVEGDGIYKCDLEYGLPFEDRSFDIVVALDVIEHLENAHQLMHEIVRVARSAAIVSLPNMYYITFRLNYLLGKGISGKYLFPSNPIKDRHRWIPSYTSAVEFVSANASDSQVQHYRIVPVRGRTRYLSGPIERTLARLNPDLFAYGALSIVLPDNSGDSINAEDAA